MSRYRVQKSAAKPVWLPMRQEYYRATVLPVGQRAQYPRSWRRLQSRLGDIRTAPFSMSVDTDRWFQRCPEQLAVGLKTIEGTFQLELAHMLRRPKRHQVFINRRDEQGDVLPGKKRNVDLFYQHTPSYRYTLDNPEHCRAFWHLLNHCCSYVGGMHQADGFRDIYRLDIMQTRELARWDIPGLWRYDADQKTCVKAVQGQEVLEVVCGPGERPRRPLVLCCEPPQDPRARAYYDREKEHWQRQVSQCRSKRIQLRVRRVDAGHLDRPAFFLNDATELDLPIPAIRRLAARLPAFWEWVFNLHEQQGNQGYPHYPWVSGAPTREYNKAQLHSSYDTANLIKRPQYDELPDPDNPGTLKRVRRVLPQLKGLHLDHRQRRWEPETVRGNLAPWMVREACRLDPQPGLFLVEQLRRGRSTEELYLLRLALWDARLLRWSPFDAVPHHAAVSDSLGLDPAQLAQIVQAFLVVWTIRRHRIARSPQPLQSFQLPRRQIDQVVQLARGPPESQ